MDPRVWGHQPKGRGQGSGGWGAETKAGSREAGRGAALLAAEPAGSHRGHQRAAAAVDRAQEAWPRPRRPTTPPTLTQDRPCDHPPAPIWAGPRGAASDWESRDPGVAGKFNPGSIQKGHGPLVVSCPLPAGDRHPGHMPHLGWLGPLKAPPVHHSHGEPAPLTCSLPAPRSHPAPGKKGMCQRGMCHGVTCYGAHIRKGLRRVVQLRGGTTPSSLLQRPELLSGAWSRGPWVHGGEGRHPSLDLRSPEGQRVASSQERSLWGGWAVNRPPW